MKMKLDTKTKAVIVFFIRKTQRRLSRPAHPIYLAASYEQSYQKTKSAVVPLVFFLVKEVIVAQKHGSEAYLEM